MKPSEVYDDYVWDTVDEVVKLFGRSSTGVAKTHAACFAWLIAAKGSSAAEGGISQDQLTALTPVVAEDLWTADKTAFIRLASLWDRVEQLLDYVFFNIRQFERDGFPAVLDRSKVNFSPISPAVTSSHFWQPLREYGYSENEQGLKWLLRRRNLLVHSVHLRADDAAKRHETLT